MKIPTIAAIATILILGLNDPLTFAATEGGKQSTDTKPEDNVYIPKDLNESFIELEKIVQPADLEKMNAGQEKDMIQYHRSLGMWMRNNWGLWRGSRLKQYFNDLGIQHPDDMSGIILVSFWRHLHAQPIRLEEQIKAYQDYWKKEKKDQ